MPATIRAPPDAHSPGIEIITTLHIRNRILQIRDLDVWQDLAARLMGRVFAGAEAALVVNDAGDGKSVAEG